MPFLRYSVTKNSVDTVNKKLVATATSLRGSDRKTIYRSVIYSHSFTSANLVKIDPAYVEIFGVTER